VLILVLLLLRYLAIDTFLRYLAIDYVVSEKKDDLQHETNTLRYLAIIKALVDYITVR
jgi:hypothetical protein